MEDKSPKLIADIGADLKNEFKVHCRKKGKTMKEVLVELIKREMGEK